MASCTTENWTLENLASALQDIHKGNKKIAVPMFQRGKCWNRNQQRTFIDSLIKGFPVLLLMSSCRATVAFLKPLALSCCIALYTEYPFIFRRLHHLIEQFYQ